MWKESLRVGVDIIDEQHKKLFEKTEELLRNLRDKGVDHKQECVEAILFLKQYAVRHFADEEAYQKSIRYKDFDAHKALHEGFVKTVLRQEEKMAASNFAEKDIKEFTGMLITWLLYHVAGIDQTIGKEVKKEPEPKAAAATGHREKVRGSARDVLHSLAGLETLSVVEKHSEAFHDSIVVEVGFTGGLSGYVAFAYPPAFVKNLVYAMTSFMPETIDELEISALFEVSNIVSAKICDRFAREDGLSGDITTPFLTKRMESHADERIALDTGIGIIEVDLAVDLH